MIYFVETLVGFASFGVMLHLLKMFLLSLIEGDYNYYYVEQDCNSATPIIPLNWNNRKLDVK